MDKRASYQEKVEAQLKEWSAKIEELKARAEKASADAKIQYHEQIEALRTKYEAAEGKFHELKTAGGHAWEDLKAGMESAWHELRSAWDTAVSKFK